VFLPKPGMTRSTHFGLWFEVIAVFTLSTMEVSQLNTVGDGCPIVTPRLALNMMHPSSPPVSSGKTFTIINGGYGLVGGDNNGVPGRTVYPVGSTYTQSLSNPLIKSGADPSSSFYFDVDPTIERFPILTLRGYRSYLDIEQDFKTWIFMWKPRSYLSSRAGDTIESIVADTIWRFGRDVNSCFCVSVLFLYAGWLDMEDYIIALRDACVCSLISMFTEDESSKTADYASGSDDCHMTAENRMHSDHNMTAENQSFTYDHNSDCDAYFVDDLKYMLPGMTLTTQRHKKKQYKCRGEYNNDVSPWFFHRNPILVQKKVCLYFLELYGPGNGVCFQSLPTIVDKLSFGAVPSTIGLHIAETICSYAFLLYRARNIDRMVICCIMYKHFRSDKDLPFCGWSEQLWGECTNMMSQYVTTLFEDDDPIDDEEKVQFQALPLESVFKILSDTTSSVKGLLLSKLVHIIIFLAATIGYISGGVPLANIPVMLERLPLHISSLQTLSVVEQVLKSIDWLKTVGSDLVTGKYKTWSDLFPNIDVSAWSEVVQKRVRTYPAIKACLARGAHGEYIEGDIVGDLYSNMRLTDDLIKAGECHLRAIGMTQFNHGKKIIGEKLSELRTIYNEMLSEQRGQASREAPLSLIIHGKSSIGKTNIIEFIKHWYCSIKGLPEGDEYSYTLNPTAKYWDGFRAYKHTLILDDIGSARVPAEDKAIEAVIRCINNVPFVPDQAALENKGQHPFLCKLVIATTNTKGFHAHHRTNNPEALHRRLKYVINVVLKPEYSDLGSLSVPENMQITEDFSLWDFQVQVASIGTDSNGNSVTKYVTIEEFVGADALLKLRDWFTKATKAHDVNQSRFMQTAHSLKTKQYCRLHNCWDCDQEHESPAPAVVTQPKEHWFSRLFKFSQPNLTPMLDAQRYKRIKQVCIAPKNWVLDVISKMRSMRNTNPQVDEPLIKAHAIAEPMLSEEEAQQFFRSAEPIDSDGEIQPAQFQSYMLEYGFIPAICAVLSSYIVFNVLVYFGNCIREWVVFCYNQLLITCCTCLDVVHAILCNLWWLHTTRQRFKLASAAIRRINYKRVCGAICIVTGAIIMCSTFSKLIPAQFQVDPEVPNVTGNEPPRNVWAGPRTLNALSPESKTLSGSSFGGRLNSLRKNVVMLYFQATDGQYTGQMTRATGFLCGQYVMTAAHSIAHVGNAMTIKIVLPACEYRSVQSEILLHSAKRGDTWVEDKSNDLLVIKTTTSLGHNIMPYFLDSNQHNAKPEAVYVLCVKPSPNCNEAAGDMPIAAPFDAVAFGNESVHAPVLKAFLKTAPHLLGKNCFSYTSNQFGLIFGDSGSVVIGQFTNGLAIIGFHTAGTNGVPYTGICPTLDRSIVTKAVSSLQIAVLQQLGVEEGIVDCGDPTFTDKDGRVCSYSMMDKRCPYYPIEGVEPLLQRNTQYIGRDIGAFTPKPKTLVQETPYRDVFMPIVRELGISELKVAPKFDYRPKRYFLDKLGKMKNYDVHYYFRKSLSALCGHIIPKLKEVEPHLEKILKPLDLHATINGIPQVQYIDSMNMSTSAGRPYNVVKKSVLNFDGISYSLKRKQYDDHLFYIDKLIAGERTNLPFKASLKDEPLAAEKNLPDGKGPRLFMCSNLDLTILIRMFFLPYARIAQRNPFLFMSAPGMNAESTQWFRLHNFLTQHGDRNLMAGDYKGFDISMMTIVTYYAFLFKMVILFCCGQYTLEQRRACYTLMYDIINPNCDIDGDHFILYGSNPSGHPLTVHTNCLANIFYVMYTWQRRGGELGDFFYKVSLMTYGDDNIMGIFEAERLNYKTMAESMLEIGVVYTKADKTCIVGGDLDSIGEVEFLKRRFEIRTYEGRDYCFAPLCMQSIVKTLTIWVRSKNVTVAEQSRDSLSAVWRSTLSHSGVTGDHIRQIISNVVDTSNGAIFPTFVAFMLQYDMDSAGVERFAATLNLNIFTINADCQSDIAMFNLIRFIELVIVAPLFEESLKRTNKYVAYIFIACEFYTYCCASDWALYIILVRLVVCYLHKFWMDLDYKTAIAVHAAYNFVLGGGFMHLLAWSVLRDLEHSHGCYVNGTICPWECRGLGIHSVC